MFFFFCLRSNWLGLILEDLYFMGETGPPGCRSQAEDSQALPLTTAGSSACVSFSLSLFHTLRHTPDSGGGGGERFLDMGRHNKIFGC